MKNAAKRIFSCKNRSRYSRKRATFCRNFANRRSLTSPTKLAGVLEHGAADELRHPDVEHGLLRQQLVGLPAGAAGRESLSKSFGGIQTIVSNWTQTLSANRCKTARLLEFRYGDQRAQIAARNTSLERERTISSIVIRSNLPSTVRTSVATLHMLNGELMLEASYNASQI